MDTFPKKPFYNIVTLDRHEGIFLMVSQMFFPPVLPGIAWHIGFAKEDWSHNDPMGTDMWNEDVKADGVSIASRGNSPWPVVPHWNLFPYPGIPVNPNVLIPLLILFSRSKSFIAVGSVIAQKGPIAVMLPGVKVIGINMACADPFPMPIINVVFVGQSTVILGFTLGDLLAALLQWAIDIALAYLMKVLGKAAGKLFKFAKGKAGSWLTSKFPAGLMNKVGNFLEGKGGPGLLKRLQLNALGKLGLPKVFNQPGIPKTALGKLDNAIFGKLDNMMGAKWVDSALGKFGLPVDKIIKPGQFTSVADTIQEKVLGKYANAIPKVIKKVALPKGDYSPSLPDRIGSWLDGSSEMVP